MASEPSTPPPRRLSWADMSPPPLCRDADVPEKPRCSLEPDGNPTSKAGHRHRKYVDLGLKVGPVPQSSCRQSPVEIKYGTVKSFCRDRGYGFIAPHDGGPGIFVHGSNVSDSVYLVSGDVVNFQVTHDVVRGKMRATEVCGGTGSLAASVKPRLLPT